MMTRMLRVARTEVLEHRRQPAMLFVLALNYVLFAGVFGVCFLAFDLASGTPELEQLLRQLQASGVEPQAALRLATSSFGALMFTNLPLFVAILSGTSVLHDRESGTLPFLMLSPLTRLQLLAGKLLGAMAIPLVLHLVFVGASSLLLLQLPVLAPYADKFGHTPAWWVALLFGAPASAAFVGALGAVVSALSKDVRTSMQYTSFFMGILGLAIGSVLIDALPEGVGMQLLFATGCLVAALVTLNIGARLIDRDVTA